MSIKLENVCYTYEKDKPILNDINLEISSGEFISILGANGSGKTTLALLLNGLIPNIIGGKFSGNVYVDELDTRLNNIGVLSKKVGIVFQDPDLIIFNLTVYEEVAFGINNLKLDNVEKRVNKALNEVDLSEFKDRDPNNISEGQKQKLCIACVLGMGTDYIVLDEPISHLDFNNSKLIYNLLKELNSQGKTIITIEHDTDFVSKYADRAIVLNEGTIKLDGPPKKILSKSQEVEKYGVKPIYN